jgi:hypothetical protein
MRTMTRKDDNIHKTWDCELQPFTSSVLSLILPTGGASQVAEVLLALTVPAAGEIRLYLPTPSIRKAKWEAPAVSAFAPYPQPIWLFRSHRLRLLLPHQRINTVSRLCGRKLPNLSMSTRATKIKICYYAPRWLFLRASAHSTD